ncbi:N-acetylmuramoyl-L-alanine amidase [candidate division WOR-3 bacterium]|nr:N-acetylmuramoyl-L-alanine amidase [candidate division WOR-3 bacterium]
MLCWLVSSILSAGQVEVHGGAIPTQRLGGVEYVPLYRVVRACGGRYWRVSDRFVAVLPGDSGSAGVEYVFPAESSVVLHNGRREVLPAACRLDGEQLLIPALAVPNLFPDATTPRLFTLETAERGDTVVVRLGLGPGRLRDSVRLMGTSSSTLEYRLGIGAPCDSALDRQLRLFSLTGGCGLLKAVVRDSAATTSLLLTFRRPAAQSVAVRGAAVEVAAWPRPQRRIARVVLDPGHGGQDPGAVGRRGTREKTLTLDIARRVKTKLEAQGFQVVMTRDSDSYVPLPDRARLASRSSADLFVSIHVNAAPNRRACGLETYFLSEAKTDWERAVAARENAALEIDLADSTLAADNVSLILADLAQNEFLFESSEMAARIQEATLPAARVNDRGVRQANFYVLRNVFMPAVLVECGFISNSSEEKLLRRPEFREKMAKGIGAGLVAFIRQYERRINGS